MSLELVPVANRATRPPLEVDEDFSSFRQARCNETAPASPLSTGQGQPQIWLYA